jgi:hypothetical protein
MGDNILLGGCDVSCSYDLDQTGVSRLAIASHTEYKL